MSCVNVFRSCSCSQSIRQRIDSSKNSSLSCHIVSQSSFEFPDLVTQISGIVQLDFLSPLRKTPLLQRSMVSRFEVLIQISQCGYRSEPPNPSCSSSRLGRQQKKSMSTKTVILSTCFCLRNLSAALGFPTRYRAARFNGTNSISRSSLILWAKCFAVPASAALFQWNQVEFARFTHSLGQMLGAFCKV